MNDKMALGLLAEIMGWTSEDGAVATQEYAWLRLMSAVKYDGYSDFRAGVRFLESLATWLQQFVAADRAAAYDFVKNRLVYISLPELQRLPYVRKVRSLVDHVASECLETSLLGDCIEASDLGTTTISIVTHGASGLEMRQGRASVWCEAVPATVVRDACGSGDMVTVGLIDWILNRSVLPTLDWTSESLLGGVVAGQRLAAANCAFAGARGFFQQFGAEMARQVLNGATVAALMQLDLFD